MRPAIFRLLAVFCLLSFSVAMAAPVTYEKKASWPETMVSAKQELLAVQGPETMVREKFVSLVFRLKQEFPREHNYFFHYYPDGFNWFTQAGDTELTGKIIPAMLAKLPAASPLHQEAMPGKSELDGLNRFLQIAQACSQLKILTPETQARSPEVADRMLVEDWLYQADGAPDGNDCRNEIAWTRQIIERLKKAGTDFRPESVALAQLETTVQKTLQEHPEPVIKSGGDSLAELLGTSIHGSLKLDIPMPNGTYTLQLLLYEGWRANGRQADILVEGKPILENYDYWEQQGKTFNGGSVVRYTFTLTDGNIDIEFKEHKDGSHLSGLILSKGQGEPGVSAHGMKSPAGLDLNNVITAINFGDTKTLTLGKVEFTAAAVNTTVKGVTNQAKGMVARGQHSQNVPVLETPVASSPFQYVYVAIRRLKRAVIFKDPAIDFEKLLLVDTPFPMRWAPESPYRQSYPNSPFIYFNEWNHQSHHRNGFNALSGSRLLVLQGLQPGGQVSALAPAASQGDGAILRPDISFDGQKILFSYKAEDEMNYHIYEINVDGTGLKQLTFGNYDDNDPIYLPDGHIMFTTTRGNTYVRCQHYSASTILARCDSDGKNIYLISQNSEPDWLPSLLADGRVVYTRWEYSDKNVMRAQGLWSTNIDGTGTAVVWGNQSVWPDDLSYPRQIPGTSKIMFAGVGHHCWFNGSIGIVDPQAGREYPEGLAKVTPDVRFEEVGDGPGPLAVASKSYHAAGKFVSYINPCPLGENLFLVSASRDAPTTSYKNSGYRFANRFRLYLMDLEGNKELVYGGEHQCLYAMPLKPRIRPPVLASTVQWPGTGKDRQPLKPGTFYSNNVYEGSGIAPGEAKYVRVIEMDYRTFSTWFSGFYLGGSIPAPQVSGTALDAVKTVLGTVPVEDDGSYNFIAPPGRQLFFELLDKDYRCLQVMRSFVGVMPGENRGCVGCHERRTTAPAMEAAKTAKALRREPSPITPPPWGIKGISYKKMIQPIFDKQCASCHMGDGKARKTLDLTLRPSSAMAGQFSEPYLTLLGSSAYMQSLGNKKNHAGGYDVSENRTAWTQDGSMRTFKPKSHFSPVSPLINLLKDGKHHGVKLSAAELQILITWVDCNTPYRDDQEVRETPDPIFKGIEMIPIRPEVKNAPVIQRP